MSPLERSKIILEGQSSVVAPITTSTMSMVDQSSAMNLISQRHYSNSSLPSSSCASSSRTTTASSLNKNRGEIELDERICRYCHQQGKMVEDWKNGDRICSNCGIIDEEHLMDSRPEWREYDNDDKANSGNLARAGLVITDETKYWGGLQPTGLSKQLYNGPSSRATSGGSSGINLRKRLCMANYRVEDRIGRLQKRQLTDAKVAYQIRKKRDQSRAKQHEFDPEEEDDDVYANDDIAIGSTEVRPEYENLVIQDEEDANRIHMALYAEKWSMERAMKLYGRDGGIGEIGTAFIFEGTDKSRRRNRRRDDGHESDNDEGDNLRSQLDKTLQKASFELYTAFGIMNKAAQKLQLSTVITNEAVAMICRYAQRRDGLSVRGVASAASSVSDENNTKTAGFIRARPNRMTYNASFNSTHGKKQLLLQQQARQQQQKQRRRMSSMDGCNKQEAEYGDNNKTNHDKECADRQKQFNQWKQMGALCSAILYYTARNFKSPRSLVDVCASIEPPVPTNDSDSSVSGAGAFIQRKHCSRAMNELKECFPDFATSSSSVDGTAARGTASVTEASLFGDVSSNSGRNDNTQIMDDTESISNFTEHALRKLCLPPVAESSIQCLVYYWRNRRQNEPDNESKDAGLTALSTKLPTLCAAMAYFVCTTGSTMQTLATQAAAAAAIEKQQREADLGRSSLSWMNKFSKSKESQNAIKEPEKKKASVSSFDVFSQDASQVNSEHRAYEMRRMWDAWAEQMPWTRSISEIAKSCGVSQKIIRDYYVQHLFPSRQRLVSLLRDSVSNLGSSSSLLCDASTNAETQRQQYPEQTILGETPLASVLLPHITVAIPLLKTDVKP